MANNFFIVSKKNQNLNFLSSNMDSSFFGLERFYSLINEYSDTMLKKHSRLLYIIVCYFFRSSNFRHTNDSQKRKSLIIWFLDIFCWLCIVGFIACLIAGIANPIVSAVTSITSGKFEDASIAWQKAFSSGTAIGLLVTAIFCFVVSMVYRYLWKKVIQVNKNLSIENYVIKKISLLNNLNYLIKSVDIVNKSTQQVINYSAKKFEDTFIFLKHTEILSNDELWKVLQIINVMHNLFLNFNLVLVLENFSDNSFEELKNIIDFDFSNITIISNVLTK